MFILGTTNASAQVPTPDTDLSTAKYYTLSVKNAAGKYATAANGQTSLSSSLSKASLWKIIADGEQPAEATKVKLYNVEKESYLVNVDAGTYADFDNATSFYFQTKTEVEGYAFISTVEGWDGQNFWNNYQGSGNRVAYYTWDWSGSADNGSLWTINEVTADDISNIYTSTVSAAQAVVDGIPSENIKTDLFYYSQAKIDALKALIAATAPTTIDGYLAAIENLTEAQNDLFNVPTTATKFFIKGMARNTTTGNYLTINNNGALVANTTKASRSVWELAPVEGGYTLQNVLTGKYVQYANSAAFTLVDDAVVMQLYPKFDTEGVIGTAAIGGTARYAKMHENGSNVIVGWERGGATNWYFEVYTENLAAELATAEEGLMASSVTAATNIATVLGIDASTLNLNSLTLKEILSGDTHNKHAYTAADGKYYRFHNTARNLTIGVAESGKPYGLTPSSSDLSQVWQLKASGNGFKLLNANLAAAGSNACIEQTVGGSASRASFTDEATAPVWTLDITSVDERKFKIADLSAWGRVNMEADGGINSWNGNNSIFTASIVESVDIALAAASIGGAYATAYLPFDVTVPADVKAYVGTINGNYVQMAEATAVAAKNGFILEGTAAGNVTLTIGGTDAATSEISGTTSAITLDDSNRSNYLLFGIGKESNQLGFYTPGAAITTIAANKAFIDNATSAALPLMFGGETTGIEAVETVNANAPMFDLSGRRILAPAKGGIYIQNGKKFIVK